MQRYFVNKLDNLITGADCHHIKNVMRMKPGDFIIVCHNKQSFRAILTKIDEIIEYNVVGQINEDDGLDITLVQGMPKASKIDFILKYATCFGVSKIIFTEMERSVAKITNIDNKQKRFDSIVKEAAELAHRNTIPKVEFVNRIQNVNFAEYDIVLLADEEEKQIRIKDLNLDVNNKSICVIIGPEGGIDKKFRDFIKNKSKSISLGNNILPTESAIIYVLSVLYENKEQLI